MVKYALAPLDYFTFKIHRKYSQKCLCLTIQLQLVKYDMSRSQSKLTTTWDSKVIILNMVTILLISKKEDA